MNCQVKVSVSVQSCGIEGEGSGLGIAVLDPVHRVMVDAVVAHGDRSSHILPVGGGGLVLSASSARQSLIDSM